MLLRPGWPLPPSLRLFESFAVAFTRPTFQRFVLLAIAAILAMGRRTVSRLLWTVRTFCDGHFSSYHRVFSHARWSLFPLGRVLAAVLLEFVPRDQPVVLAGDDTTTEHRGKHVFGKACHRDAVHSAHGGTVQLKWGHKWVVLAIHVLLPFCKRAWALPALSALHVPPPADPPTPPPVGSAAASKDTPSATTTTTTTTTTDPTQPGKPAAGKLARARPSRQGNAPRTR